MLMRLVRSLMQTDVKARIEREFPQIHQIYIYSCLASHTKPVWSAPIYLNRLEHHLERLMQAVAVQPETAQPETAQPETNQLNTNRQPTDDDSSALARQLSETSSEMGLARQGDSGAIARYLSEALSALNVGVQVSARVVPGKARRAQAIVGVNHQPSELEPSDVTPSDAVTSAEKEPDTDTDCAAAAKPRDLVSRLWIFCEASYSPDPLLIAEPIAERLRRLHLRQFQDAVITIQVTGEVASDWRLRVDLTPPEDMLKEWARWGDLPALSRLANQISRRYGLKLIAEVKKATLHLISYPITATQQPSHQPSKVAQYSQKDTEKLVTDISQQLQAVAPQGLQRAMLYGPSTDDISPEWLRGIELPASQNPALAEPAATLAAKGDMPALAYCLTRALNPDIKDQLATGGIRVQLLLKDKLLHVMADGPVCPPKHAIVPLVTQTLTALKAAGLIDGIRLYGRRAGQKQPIWTHGHDYKPRQRMVPEAKPEFAASEAYIGELITPVSEQSLAVDLIESDEVEADIRLSAVLIRAVQQILIKSQLFTPIEDTESLHSQMSPMAKTENLSCRCSQYICRSFAQRFSS
ncbi:MAG: hypothetical protein HC800_09615 [Phormidesmis sp. RL_2_1]|nr:hypothetical protein [Phormidesmis sp. RL_2_1]